MVRRVDKFGSVYHEPPYTEEEQMELYRSMAMGPHSSFTRPTGPAKKPDLAKPTVPPSRRAGPKRR
jgi:hypothetical protein